MSENHENHRLEYLQIMENYRQALRSSTAAVIMFLAINGLIFPILADNKLSPIYTTIVVVFIITLGLLFATIGIIAIKYFRGQQARIISLSKTLGFSSDNTLLYTVKVAYIAFYALIVIIIWWLLFLIVK